MSRIVDCLEGRGLVRRERCSSDAHGWEAAQQGADGVPHPPTV